MGADLDRCTKCGHLLASHDARAGCTERVPGTLQRPPGPCTCGAPGVMADVLPFRKPLRRQSPVEEGD